MKRKTYVIANSIANWITLAMASMVAVLSFATGENWTGMWALAAAVFKIDSMRLYKEIDREKETTDSYRNMYMESERKLILRLSRETPRGWDYPPPEIKEDKPE